MNRKLALAVFLCAMFFLAFDQINFVGAKTSTPTSTQQSDKESLFKEFNDKKRSDPKEAYRLARAYLEKYGKDQDENTRYVKEWVTAYEAVMSRTAAGDSKTREGAVTSTTATISNAGASPATTLDMNGTTWQVKGKENGKPWAEIFAFRAGGRFQYERYGADGSSNLWAGTWRQLDESIFVTLLGADGNPIGTIRAESNKGWLSGTLKLQGLNDRQFLMESESVPHVGKEAEAFAAEYRAARDREEETKRRERDREEEAGRRERDFQTDISWLRTQSETFGVSSYSFLFKVGPWRWSKVDLNKPTGPKATYTQRIVGFDGCQMVVTTLTEKPESDSNYASTLSSKITVPLKSLDPAGIKVFYQKIAGQPEAWFVSFTTLNKDKALSIETELKVFKKKGLDKRFSENVESFAIMINDKEETSQKVGQVLSRVIEKCKSR
ncbi:MAG: hypothetical protein ACRD9S_13520 [Pyrinomonadaceae bacterium]